MKQKWDQLPPNIQEQLQANTQVQIKVLVGEFQGRLELEFVDFVK